MSLKLFSPKRRRKPPEAAARGLSAASEPLLPSWRPGGSVAANDERLRATCALWAGGFVRRQRHAVTNQPNRPRARYAAGALQAAIVLRPAKTIDRPALTPRRFRLRRQPGGALQAFAFGEGLWDKVRMDQRRRGGSGVKWNRGRASKRFHLRPGSTGGSASRSVTNSPKRVPDARPCPGGAGGKVARG